MSRAINNTVFITSGCVGVLYILIFSIYTFMLDDFNDIMSKTIYWTNEYILKVYLCQAVAHLALKLWVSVLFHFISFFVFCIASIQVLTVVGVGISNEIWSIFAGALLILTLVMTRKYVSSR